MARKSSVDKLKDRLYSRTSSPKVDPKARTPLSEGHQGAPRIWSDIRTPGVRDQTETPAPPAEVHNPALTAVMPPIPKTPLHGFAMKFLWGSLVFFVLALGLAAYAILGNNNTISPQNIDVQIVSPALIDSGKQAQLQFVIQNRNTTALQAVDLVIDYPGGTRDASDPTTPLLHQRISIGNLAPGQQVQETSQALMYGELGAQQKIVATLEYQVAGSNAIFTKESDALFTIGSAPLTVTVTSPAHAISGQQFEMDITVESNATSPISDVAIEGQYPFGYRVQSSSPAADVGGTFWRLGTLNPGQSQIVHLIGALTGENGDVRVFHFLVGSEPDQTRTILTVPLLSVPQTLTIEKPFVSGVLSLDGQTGSTVAEPLGKSVQGQILWQNNATDTVENLTFTLSLTGQALDPRSISGTNGFYDSSKSQIVWSSQSIPDLSSAGPGSSGILQFSFATLPPSASLIVNPTLSLNLTVGGTLSNGSGTSQSVSSAAAAVVNLSSAVSLEAHALHFTGPFSETGPVPPKAGQPTTYAIVWSVQNSSNTVAGGLVSAVLPPNVIFDGAGTSGAEQVTYDDPTRAVTWTLSEVKPGTGYSLALRQAAFQVTLTPSLSQVGFAAPLTGAAQFSGEDRFAQKSVTASVQSLSTDLTSDPGFQHGMDIVTQ